MNKGAKSQNQGPLLCQNQGPLHCQNQTQFLSSNRCSSKCWHTAEVVQDGFAIAIKVTKIGKDAVAHVVNRGLQDLQLSPLLCQCNQHRQKLQLLHHLRFNANSHVILTAF